MMATAQGKMSYLVKRNIKDYQPTLLSVMQPLDYLATP
jgi:hypothetical protein